MHEVLKRWLVVRVKTYSKFTKIKRSFSLNSRLIQILSMSKYFIHLLDPKSKPIHNVFIIFCTVITNSRLIQTLSTNNFFSLLLNPKFKVIHNVSVIFCAATTNSQLIQILSTKKKISSFTWLQILSDSQCLYHLLYCYNKISINTNKSFTWPQT